MLRIIRHNDLELRVRQATVIYLKNFITKYWLEKDDNVNVSQLEFSIHEHDRVEVRRDIVNALVAAPPLIQLHIATCIYHIIKSDYPGRWLQVVGEIKRFLEDRNCVSCSGAILCLYQLVKNYEYKKADDREPLDKAMEVLLPMIYDLMREIMNPPTEQTQDVILLQKNILKIYYTLIQVSEILYNSLNTRRNRTNYLIYVCDSCFLFAFSFVYHSI